MEIISLIKDVVISGAAITGAIVAVKGLNTWNRQLKGKHEYELSRRILVSLFKFRDVIFAVRKPAIWPHEMESPPEGEQKSQEYIRYFGVSKAYQARGKKVVSEKTILYADLLEAEAIWGGELRKPFKRYLTLSMNCLIAWIVIFNF